MEDGDAAGHCSRDRHGVKTLLTGWMVLTLQAITPVYASCDNLRALVPPFPSATAAEQGLAVALQGQFVAIWPEDSRNEINEDAGIVVYFDSGDQCELRVVSRLAHGLIFRSDNRNIRSIEAAICDPVAGMCVSVVVPLAR